MKVHHLLGFLLLYAVSALAQPQRTLSSEMHHLRTGDESEWSSFRTVPQKQLVLHFDASHNLTEHTLRLRQEDVKQPWIIDLNGRELGRLLEDENPMLGYWKIPAGIIQSGRNILTIRQRTTVTDDIRVGQIVLLDQPMDKVLHQAKVEVTVLDRKTNRPVPAKITITNRQADQALQPVGAASDQVLAVRSGCVYTGGGVAAFGLPAGTYTLYASRGFEYSVDSLRIQIKTGESLSTKLYLTREVPTAGWISSDPHVHTYTHSRHGDATDQERVVTLAGEDVELPVLTDHNLAIDLAPIMREMKLDGWFTPVVGNEFTTAVGHFNIFPELPEVKVPDHRVTDWTSVARNLGDASGPKAIILNHARDVHINFRPFGPERHLSQTGTNLDGWLLPANAMEVLNSGSQQHDVMQLYRDWFGMMNRGYLLTPVGSSDSHDVSRYVVGQSRTYIKYPNDQEPGNIDIAKATEAFRQGRVSVSFGLLPEITVSGSYGPGELAPAVGGAVVNVRVLGPSWIQAERVSLYANGRKIREARISGKGRNGVKWQGTWKVPMTGQDVHLVAIAEGPGPSYPFWAVAKPYQRTSPDWTPRVIGSTGAVWVDSDGDGQRTSAYQYARQILDSSKEDINSIIRLLAVYDEAVAMQAAYLLMSQKDTYPEQAVREALKAASPAVKKGFEEVEKAWQKSGRTR